MINNFDVLLIRPQTKHDLVGNPPLGLGFISAAVKNAGYRARVQGGEKNNFLSSRG